MQYVIVDDVLCVQVSVESEAAVFTVGVAHKPLFNKSDGSSTLWALEAHTGKLPSTLPTLTLIPYVLSSSSPISLCHICMSLSLKAVVIHMHLQVCTCTHNPMNACTCIAESKA